MQMEKPSDLIRRLSAAIGEWFCGVPKLNDINNTSLNKFIAEWLLDNNVRLVKIEKSNEAQK